MSGPSNTHEGVPAPWTNAAQRTNSMCKGRICELLGAGRLDVFARSGDAPYRIGSFTVNEAAAREDVIIRDLQPAWNKMGK
jgi:hypothetical protein